MLFNFMFNFFHLFFLKWIIASMAVSFFKYMYWNQQVLSFWSSLFCIINCLLKSAESNVFGWNTLFTIEFNVVKLIVFVVVSFIIIFICIPISKKLNECRQYNALQTFHSFPYSQNDHKNIYLKRQLVDDWGGWLWLYQVYICFVYLFSLYNRLILNLARVYETYSNCILYIHIFSVISLLKTHRCFEFTNLSLIGSEDTLLVVIKYKVFVQG